MKRILKFFAKLRNLQKVDEEDGGVSATPEVPFYGRGGKSAKGEEAKRKDGDELQKLEGS